MFDIGWSELLVIGIVALVVIGPKELPGVVRTVAQNIGKLRRLASDFQNQFNDALREMELADLKKDAEKLISDATSAASLLNPNARPRAPASRSTDVAPTSVSSSSGFPAGV